MPVWGREGSEKWGRIRGGGGGEGMRRTKRAGVCGASRLSPPCSLRNPAASTPPALPRDA